MNSTIAHGTVTSAINWCGGEASAARVKANQWRTSIDQRPMIYHRSSANLRRNRRVLLSFEFSSPGPETRGLPTISRLISSRSGEKIASKLISHPLSTVSPSPFDPLDLRLLEGLCVMRSNRVNLSPSLLERRERFRLRPATIAADDYAYPRN